MIQLPSGLIVPSAERGQAQGGRPVLDELAPLSGGRDITRTMVDSLPLLPPQDSLTARRGGPLPLDLYWEVLDDWQVASVLGQRREAVVSTDWEVIPGGTSRKDKTAAQFIQAILDALPWDSISRQMHFGIFFGHAVAECLWATDGAQVVPGEIRVRDARRFAYRPDGSLVLLTQAHATDGEPLPPRKFWTFQTGSVHGDDPYGMGLAHWCYWPVQFKRGTIKLMLVFLDKFASPTALGHFPASATPAERARLLRALEAIRSQSALILPEGMTAELLSAARSGTVDYLEANRYWDAAISKVIAGHSAAADATPGRLGGEDSSREIAENLVTADADLLNSSANLSWVRWCVDWSYPGAAYPLIWRRTEEDEDLNTRAERETKIYTLGYRPTLAQIQETYGGEWEATTPAPGNPVRLDPSPPDPAGAPSAPADPQAAFAEGPSPDGLDALVDEALADWEPVLRPLVEPLRQAIEQAAAAGETLEQALVRLLAAVPDQDPQALTEALTRAATAARLAGLAGAEPD